MKNRNLYFEAFGLIRAGQQIKAAEILQKTHPEVSQGEILRAIKIGKDLNEKVWQWAEDCRDGLVEKEEIKRKIKKLCPELNEGHINHIFANALFDTR